jgi:hypothetical protein
MDELHSKWLPMDSSSPVTPLPTTLYLVALEQGLTTPSYVQRVDTPLRDDELNTLLHKIHTSKNYVVRRASTRLNLEQAVDIKLKTTDVNDMQQLQRVGQLINHVMLSQTHQILQYTTPPIEWTRSRHKWVIAL